MCWIVAIGWLLLGLLGAESWDHDRTTPPTPNRVAVWCALVLTGPIIALYMLAYVLSDGFTRWP